MPRTTHTIAVLTMVLLAASLRAQTPPTRDPHTPGYVSATTLADGTNASPTEDGNFILGPTHTPAPEMTINPKIPQGKTYQFTLSDADSKFYPNLPGTPPSIRYVDVYVPAQYLPGTPAPFLFVTRMPSGKLFTVLDSLIAAHRVPTMVAISFGGGGSDEDGDTQGGEGGREFDTMSGRFGEFVEQEVLPRVEQEAHVHLTTDPDGRAAMGVGSGGAAAFAMAWFHPELYNRVLTYSGNYVNMQWPPNPHIPHGAADLYQHLIPDSPAKPLRIWMEVGDRDLLNPHIMHAQLLIPVPVRDKLFDWVVGNEEMARALAAKSYHYQFVFAQNAAHVDYAVVQQTLPEALEYLWRDDGAD